MLDFLFRRLTTETKRGAALFEAATAEARQAHWFREGAVPDTLEGRFAMLSTIVALTLARLEREGEAGDQVSVALTERFIEVMESEHRELGLGDPTLGKTVRKLVGALARRTQLWRNAVSGTIAWSAASRESLYKGEVGLAASEHAAEALARVWERLERTNLEALAEGRIG